jgi:formylglycine-generating enzyme required for sulfatase activity
MKNKWILYLLITFATQFVYAQKPFANSVSLESAIFLSYAQPVSIALWKFDGDVQLDISLYKELLKYPLVHNKFLIFPFKSIEQLIEDHNLLSLSGQDSKLRKTLKKELDISVILFGERKVNGKIQLSIMDTESSKMLYTGEFEESLNSIIEADIVKLLLSDEKTLYQNIGLLNLILNPIDCAVQLDGDLILLRENIELIAGQHYLTFSKDGYYSKSDSVLIISGQKTQHTLSLKEITGRIVITSIPPAFKIFRIGETIIKKFESSIDTIDIKPGEYTIELEAPGYKKKDKILRVIENKVIALDISLEKEELPAKLSVSVNVKDCEIVIKEGEQTIKSFTGEIKDFTIKKGNYKILVNSKGYLTQEKNIQLFAGQSLLEQVTLQKPAGPRSKDPTTVTITIGQSKEIEFVKIQGGNFDMGSDSAATPITGKYVHRVNLDDFDMGKYEVTNLQYVNFLNSYETDEVKEGEDCGEKLFYYSPRGIRKISELGGKQIFAVKPDYLFYPANNITWFGAREFCRYYGYRLPSEAEWEFASRERGQKIKYGNGQNIASNTEINFLEYEIKKKESIPQGDSVLTSHVCDYKPNNLGLYDMSGNVWEWCQDWYSDSYYLSSKMDNPAGPAFGSYKVIRGGSWYSSSAGIETTRRNFLSPSNAKFDVGFRVVREILKDNKTPE